MSRVPGRPGTERPGVAVLWPLAALIAGVVGLVVAFAPFGPIGVVLGGLGIVAGATAVQRFRAAHALLVLSVAGLVASALAVPVGIVTLFPDSAPPQATVRASKPRSLHPMFNTDVADVLEHDMEVKFGTYEYAMADEHGSPYLRESSLPVTVINKRDSARMFEITIGAYDAGGEQIAASNGNVRLGGHCSQDVRVFGILDVKSAGIANRLKSAAFRVTSVKAGTPYAPF